MTETECYAGMFRDERVASSSLPSGQREAVLATTQVSVIQEFNDLVSPLKDAIKIETASDRKKVLHPCSKTWDMGERIQTRLVLKWR